jgi:hypothetical protein
MGIRTGIVALAALVCAATAAAAPSEPAPRGALPGSPQAWVQTARGDFWLAPGSGCWTFGCVNYGAPTCAGSPAIRLRRGERVRFHLPFSAHGAALRVGTRTFRLDGGHVFSWRAHRGGLAVLATDADQGGASFAACFRVARDPLVA